MWKLVFNIAYASFYFGCPKWKTHKVQMNIAPFKNFKKYAFGTKYWKYGQILTIQKSLTIK